MAFKVEVLNDHPKEAAARIGADLPPRGSVVLTGGTTAEKIYPFLALQQRDWSRIEVLFSDERCVPPDDPASNFKMATDLLLNRTSPGAVHRMRGEDEPAAAAIAYHDEIASLVDAGLDLMLLGMGADAHVGANFPDSPAVKRSKNLCRAVDRPDGMKGLTLTPRAILFGVKVLLLVTGNAKADTVRRVIEGDEDPTTCPARLLAGHPDVTFLLDQAAASRLSR
ncbi:MAG TPA: 6-phosphogluconolactonase [Actinomycetota bacterium]|nr:6-phosphogluconolactonase [Actinomycetota bacterium]